MSRSSPGYLNITAQLLEAVPDAIVIVDPEGQIVLVNKQVEALSGYAPAEVIGRPVEDLVPELLRSKHVQHRTAYQRSPSVRSMGMHLDIRFRRKDGSEFPADIALSPMRTEQGSLVVASVRDVTEQKQAEEELLHAEERFRRVVEGIRDYAIFMLDSDGNVSTWTPAAARMKGYEPEEILGRHFSVLYPQADVDDGKPARALAESAAKARYEDEGWRVRKDGSRFWASVVITAIHDQAGKLLGFAKITRDITERKRQEDRTRAVLEVAQATLEGRAEEDLVQLIAERARALADADFGMVLLVDAEMDSLYVAGADGPSAVTLRGRRLEAAGSLTADLFSSGNALLLDEAGDGAAGLMSLLEPSVHGPALVVRLSSGKRGFGALTVTKRLGSEGFTDTDKELLELFSAQAAVTIDYTRAREELQHLAVLQDRQRIGRELHDGAIQALFAVGMSLQAMAMMTHDQGLRDRLESSVGQIDDVIRDLRNYIFGLRPGLGADRHLGQALQELADQLERQHGVACAVDLDEAVTARLAGHSAEIVQMVREALSNVARHSAATTCRLSLRGESGSAVLEVEDDGRGLAAAEADHGGWGLRNLKDRTAAMGGSIDISSVLGEGTLVRLRFPI